ncbi:hypothetical protein AQUCO_00400254v1 [Aquilegia coerulea]|uniref:Trigger factor ribosome-binding bacterial domain-containing protein n=1 Tax=Aquilegia coerulea TaxID=218851 RepID=A0A2G5EU72_AQUCA|nr:hypothetical protein AQUCO_00400254v1 [Aquilegia coerulea]
MLLSCLSSVGMNNTVGLSCLTISSLKIITPNPNVAYRTTTNVNTSTSIRVHFHQTSQHLFNGLSFGHGRGSRWVSQPTYAVKPELDTSVTEMKDIGTTLRKAKVVIESREGDTIQVRVDLTGKETQKVFDDVLTNLAKTAPAVPGFRKQKGGRIDCVLFCQILIHKFPYGDGVASTILLYLIVGFV